MEWLNWAYLILIGFGTGLCGVVVGAGGGFILGPILLIFFDIEPEIVAGTTLALVAINSISGGIAFKRMGLVDIRSGLLFAAAALPGAIGAPFVIGAVEGNLFRLLFGILLVILSVGLILRQKVPESQDLNSQPNQATVTKFISTVVTRTIITKENKVYMYEFNELLAMSVNIFLGFASSFFGTGGGFLRTPLLVYLFNFPVQIAVATSIFTLTFVATAGVITHVTLGNINWFPVLIMSGFGIVIGGQIGARIANKLQGVWIMRILLVLVLTLGGRLIYEGLFI